jgi:UDP-glucose 4-epimerase
MRILVTGGAGFIGSHVVDRYVELGHEVIVIDDLSTGREEYVNKGAKFYKLDIRDRKSLEKIFKDERPDIVNHHAAQISVQNSIRDPIFDADVNVKGSLNLIELSLKYDVKKFIYISSGGAVYGEPKYLPCDEEHPVNPLSPYGVSKHVVEHYLYLYFVNYNLDYLVLRYPNVYGPRQDPFGEAGVVAIFTMRMLKDEEVIINGDGTQERDFVYVDDIVEANVLSLDSSSLGESPTDRIFNLGSGRGTSVNEIFKYLSQLTGYRRKPTHGPPKPGEVYKISLSAKRAEKFLGWRERFSLEEGLRETVDWFRKTQGEE